MNIFKKLEYLYNYSGSGDRQVASKKKSKKD